MRTWKAILLAVLGWTVPVAGQEQDEIRVYNIHHALFGDIGTLTDQIMREGLETRVATRAEVNVCVLGITLHRVQAEWSEIWHEDALKEYRAITMRNGRTTSISGQHKDGKFILRTQEREFTAPADIHPVHPWSLRFVRAATLISPESGRIFPASIVDGGDETISVGGAKRRVRHYVATFDNANHLYFDENGVLLFAEYRDIAGSVRFTLQATGERSVASVQ
jgi:hypothetical protein